MEAFAVYLLRSMIWLTGFALVYFLFLRNERFFLLKRYYLIAGILISFIFPLFTIRYQVDLPAPVTGGSFEPAGLDPAYPGPQTTPGKAFDYKYILLIIYLSGILFLTYRMIKQIGALLKTINKAEKNRLYKVMVIRTSEIKDSFSFFNYIFINPSLDKTELEMIMSHEIVHVNQKHWFDLLLVESIRLFQWINPVAWIYSGFIRQNHEYIADEAALQRTSDPAIYKAVLVNQLFDSPVLSLTNSFNYSLNKKRFDMMKKIVASPYRKMKILLVLPVFAIVFYAFASPEYHYVTDTGTPINNSQLPGSLQKKAGGIVVNENGKPLQGVSIIPSNALSGVITDADGKFAIAGIPDRSSLIFSLRGYKSYTLPPLTASNQNLYVKMVKDPDYKEELKIRTSDGSEVKALVVVDGVISKDNIGKVDPDAILTMTVLKDEEATAKYGEKGKNGVIEITTKKRDAQTLVANQRTVKGIVLNQEGKPLAGANVTATGAMGNASFATTGPDGKFELNSVQADALLIFGCRGFKKLSLKPDFNSEMTVKMEMDPDFKEAPVLPATQRPEPVVIIDGVISDRTFNEARKELGYNLGPVKLLPAKEATEKFGEKGVNGAWEITTRKKAIEMGLKPMFPRLSPDDYPTFQGQRYFSFNDWVKGQVRYPEEAKAKQIEGWVQVNFTVNLDGTISNVKSIGTADKILVDEVIRVVNSSPKWEPPRNSEVDEPFTSNLNLKFKLPDQIGEEEPFVVVEQMPHYPGGEVELLNFIRDNTKYPEAARANKIQGKVIIRFIVNTQGKAEGISVIKGVDPELDFEAVRVISMLSGFTPGMQGGKAVNVWYMVPVNFELTR